MGNTPGLVGPPFLSSIVFSLLPQLAVTVDCGLYLCVRVGNKMVVVIA